MTEHSIAKRLFNKWLSSDTVAHNVKFFDFESDVLALKPSGYLIEYEIKLTVSDFRADFKKRRGSKSRYDHREKVTRHNYLLKGHGANRFYYVMPREFHITHNVRPLCDVADFETLILIIR